MSEAGKLLKVKHVSGDEVDCTHCSITTMFVSHDNFMDWGACFVLKPMPAMKVHLLFKAAGTGPYKIPQLSNNNKFWAQLVDSMVHEWRVARAAAAAIAMVDIIGDAKRKLEDHEDQIKKDRAVKVRAQAAVVLEQKRARKPVVLVDA